MLEPGIDSVITGIFTTWAIGLLPPVLIRYAIMRRPVSKAEAICACIVFYFVNIFIFVALGSQSKSHAVLILIAFVSYWILRRGIASSQADKH